MIDTSRAKLLSEKYTLSLLFQLRAVDLPEPEQETRFHPVRRWRFDLAYPAQKVAVEIEGGSWQNGRHTRGKGYETDCEKYSEAAVLGWKVIRCTPAMVEDGRAVDLITRALKGA